MNQHLLRRLNPSLPKPLKRGAAGRRNCGSFFEREVRRLQRHCVLPRRHVLGVRAEPAARDVSENFIPALELGDVAADRFNGSCDVIADYSVFGLDEASHQPERKRRSTEKMPIGSIRRCRMNAHQHIIVTNGGSWNVVESQNIRWAVSFANNCFHCNGISRRSAFGAINRRLANHPAITMSIVPQKPGHHTGMPGFVTSS